MAMMIMVMVSKPNFVLELLFRELMSFGALTFLLPVRPGETSSLLLEMSTETLLPVSLVSMTPKLLLSELPPLTLELLREPMSLVSTLTLVNSLRLLLRSPTVLSTL